MTIFILSALLAIAVITCFVLLYLNFKRDFTKHDLGKKVSRLKESLAELKILNQEVLDNIPVSIAVIDDHGEVILTNSFFKKLVPWYKPENGLNLLKSKTMAAAGLTSKYENVLKTGISFSQKGVMVKNHNSQKYDYINFNVVPIKNSEQQVTGAISIGQVVTPLVKAKDDLEKANHELNLEVQKRTEEFYAINNHLSEKNEFYEKIFDYIAEKINKTVSEISLNNQVDIKEKERHEKFIKVYKDFIFLNQMEKNNLNLNLQRLNFADFIGKTFSSYQIEIDDSVYDTHVLLDNEKISHILFSLLDRFGEGSQRVSLDLQRSGQQARLNLKFHILPEKNADALISDFFWEMQLLMYKEIINMHKGFLKEDIKNDLVSFDIRFLTEGSFSLVK